ncbi:MAG: hypothetical protein QOE27_505 [Solirubrobacteraceae bacterium]|nr:hypothetical protein [Solirubrobacteraceae bacterium]
MLGPSDGCHSLRERDDLAPAWVVALATLTLAGDPVPPPPPTAARIPGTSAGRPAGARRRGPGTRRGPRAAPVPGGPARVSVSRATVIDTRPLAGPDEADAWLARIDAADEAARALAVVNRLIGAHRIAAADPYAHELPPGAALALRAGFGDGQEVATGGWTRAVELSPTEAGRRRRARTDLDPQERLAGLLAARDRPLACEELALRARLDLDLGRPLAAALETRAALDAALVELAGNARGTGLEARLTELHTLRDDVIAAANSALAGPLPDHQRRTVEHGLERIEAALRARRRARAPTSP